MTNYIIKSIKTADEESMSLEGAVERARAILEEYQPAYGVQIEINGKTIASSDESCDFEIGDSVYVEAGEDSDTGIVRDSFGDLVCVGWSGGTSDWVEGDRLEAR